MDGVFFVAHTLFLDYLPIPAMAALLLNGQYSRFSRSLNSLFSFSTIGVQDGKFSAPAGGPSNILCGRTYHRILDITRGEHSMKWFLYDEATRQERADQIGIPQSTIDVVKAELSRINPYIDHYRTLSQQPAGIPYALELKDTPSAAGEISAIVPANSISRQHPQSVYI